MTRLVVAVALVLATLAGCGGGSSSEEGAPESAAPTTAPAVRTLAELEAALPRTGQVPGGDKKLFSCPGSKGCEDNEAGVVVQLQPSLTADEVKARYGAYVLPENVDLTAAAWSDAATAEGAVADARAAERPFVGEFATKGEDTSDTAYTFGAKGKGTIADLTVDGWKGYLGRRAQVLTNPDGDPDSGPVVRVDMHLWNGATTVRAVVSVLDDEERSGDSETLARELIEDYIGRLG